MNLRTPPSDPEEDRWQWDMVTWAVILLIVFMVLFFVGIVWYSHPFPMREQ